MKKSLLLIVLVVLFASFTFGYNSAIVPFIPGTGGFNNTYIYYNITNNITNNIVNNNNITNNITVYQMNYTNVALTNQSVNFGINNVTANWFIGKINWSNIQNAPNITQMGGNGTIIELVTCDGNCTTVIEVEYN